MIIRGEVLGIVLGKRRLVESQISSLVYKPFTFGFETG